LRDARAEQREPDWQADYRATRPKVKPKLGHLTRGKHGGRRARVRGKDKADADFNLLAAAVNVAGLTVLGLRPSTHRMGRRDRLTGQDGSPAGADSRPTPAPHGRRTASCPRTRRSSATRGPDIRHPKPTGSAIQVRRGLLRHPLHTSHLVLQLHLV